MSREPYARAVPALSWRAQGAPQRQTDESVDRKSTNASALVVSQSTVDAKLSRIALDTVTLRPSKPALEAASEPEAIDEPRRHRRGSSLSGSVRAPRRPRPRARVERPRGKRPGRARQALGRAAGQVLRKLAGRSPPAPAPSAAPPVATDARTFTPEQMATLVAALGIVRRDRAGSRLDAEEMAILKAALEILGVPQPDRGRAPAGKLREVARRASAFIAGEREPARRSKRRGLLARLRRGGDDEPDG